MTKIRVRRVVALAALVLAMQTTGADDVVPDTDEGWNLTPNCTGEGETRCLASAAVWERTKNGDIRHVASVNYNCKVAESHDEGYFGHLYLYTQTRKGSVRTEPPAIVRARWDDEEEVHEVPVQVQVGKVKGKINQRDYWFAIGGVVVKGTLARLDAHERLHIEWPHAKKRENPIWVSVNLTHAVEAIRAAAERCGGRLAEALFAPPDSEGT